LSRNIHDATFVAILAPCAVLVLLACGGNSDKGDVEESRPLARVGDVEITDADFEQALARLDVASDSTEKTPEEWRQWFQLLIDRELLLIEARRQGLENDAQVEQEVKTWERTQLIQTLLQAEMGDQLSWNERELRDFFEETGAGQEIRLSRLVLADRTQAVSALQKARSGEDFARLVAAHTRSEYPYHHGDLGWMNPLTLTNPRLSSLFPMAAGTVELIEADGLYFLIAITDKRQVSLEECRPVVEEALQRKKQREANLAYLEHLTSKYEVRLDTAALGSLLRAASLDQVNPSLRLVQSTLGDWSVGEYLDALKTIAEQEVLSLDSAPVLGFQITRAYIVARLLAEEARGKGVFSGIEERREKVRHQKMIETLWRRHTLEKVPFTQAELSAFYEANKARYETEKGAISAAQLQNRIAQDLREAKAAPLFEEYLAQLRQQHSSAVFVDEERLQEFVARRQQAETPVKL